MFLDNGFNSLELDCLVRSCVKPVKECAVHFVVEHLGQLVAGDLVDYVNSEQTTLHAHDVFESVDVLLFTCCRFELIFNHV